MITQHILVSKSFKVLISPDDFDSVLDSFAGADVVGVTAAGAVTIVGVTTGCTWGVTFEADSTFILTGDFFFFSPSN